MPQRAIINNPETPSPMCGDSNYNVAPDQALLTALANEVIMLDREWMIFQAIYHNEDRWNRFHNAAPTTCSILALAMMRDTTLMVVRLLDPATTTVRGSSRPNRTLWSLNCALDKSLVGYPQWKIALQEVNSIVKTKYKPGRDKLISHLDKHVASGTESIEIPFIRETNEFISKLQYILDLASVMIRGTKTPWSIFRADINNEISRLCPSAAPRDPQR